MLGQLANQEMERVAGLLVSDLASKGMTLDYTPASLGKVDQLLANCGHSKGNGQANMGLVELVGAQLEAGNKSLAFLFSDASTRLQDWRGQASHGA